MTFKVGQKVVYPNHGVTVVEEIAPSRIDGTERTCYHLRLLSGNSKVMVPKDNLDLVHARSRAPAWSAYKACKNTEAHFITTCHAPYNISGEAKRLYNRSIAQGELVIAISDYVADYLRKNYDLDTGKIRVIPRGIPIERFHPTAVTPERLITLSRELRIPEGSNIIMMLSLIHISEPTRPY